MTGFTGKEADEEVGVVYFGEWYLIPRIGRWASPDPLHVHAVGGGEALNSYQYVGGNVLNARDPDGLSFCLGGCRRHRGLRKEVPLRTGTATSPPPRPQTSRAPVGVAGLASSMTMTGEPVAATAGLIVIGALLLAGTVMMSDPHLPPVQAPPARPPVPVSAPGRPRSGSVSEPTASDGPAGLPPSEPPGPGGYSLPGAEIAIGICVATSSAAVEDDEDVTDLARHPDGSLRDGLGRFRSESGRPAPGTQIADNFAEHLRDNGMDVVGTELTVRTPVDLRRYDIAVRLPDGSSPTGSRLHGIEVKSGTATRNRQQRMQDNWVNEHGARGVGDLAGQRVDSATVVHLDPDDYQ